MAEEDPALRSTLLLLNKITDRAELRASIDPIGPLICPIGPLTTLDIHLRVEAQLAKAHDRLEENELATTITLLFLPAAHGEALDSTVELGLFLRVEVKNMLDVERLLRGIRNRGAEVVHRAAENVLLIVDIGFEKCKERLKITDTIHDRSTREKPLRLHVECRDKLPARTRFLGETVSLVADKTIPMARHEARTTNSALVVADIEVRLLHVNLVADGMPRKTLNRPTGDARLLRSRDPLVHNGERKQGKGVLSGRHLDKANHLDRLAEPHLIAQ